MLRTITIAQYIPVSSFLYYNTNSDSSRIFGRAVVLPQPAFHGENQALVRFLTHSMKAPILKVNKPLLSRSHGWSNGKYVLVKSERRVCANKKSQWPTKFSLKTGIHWLTLCLERGPHMPFLDLGFDPIVLGVVNKAKGRREVPNERGRAPHLNLHFPAETRLEFRQSRGNKTAVVILLCCCDCRGLWAAMVVEL